MKNIAQITAAIEASKTRSAWSRGVKAYALELLEELTEAADYNGREPENVSELYDWMLNGANEYRIDKTRRPIEWKIASWKVYSEGGSSLIYDTDICERLCTATEKKITRNGEKDPSPRETWLQVQARALYQAAELITREARRED